MMHIAEERSPVYTKWCDFCIAQAVHGDVGMTTEYRKFSKNNIISREITVTNHFRLIVALGPIVEGNLLIIPHEHKTSMRQLEIPQREELLHLKHQIWTILSRYYSAPIFFEHGFISDGNYSPESSNCIDHAHLQVLPNTPDFLEEIQSRYSGIHLPSAESFFDADWENSNYLYYESAQGGAWVFTADSFDHQLLRQLAFSKLGRSDEWNWRKYPKIDVIHKTVQQLAGTFS